MRHIPSHITALSRQDMAEIVRATNPVSGTGMKIILRDGEFEIGLDEQQIKLIIYAVVGQLWNMPALPKEKIDQVDIGNIA